MKKIYRPLDQEEFQRRIAESFPTVYLTLISIIQGVALVILATESFKYINEPDPKLTEPWYRFSVYSIISFVTLIVLSYQYTWFIGIFRWSPRFWDILIPFCLGLSEVSPMFYFTKPLFWWGLTGIFSFVGALALYNTKRSCKKPMFGDDANAFIKTINILNFNIRISIIAFFLCLSFSILLYFEVIPQNINYHYPEVIFIILLSVCMASMFYVTEKFMKDIHKDFGLER